MPIKVDEKGQLTWFWNDKNCQAKGPNHYAIQRGRMTRSKWMPPCPATGGTAAAACLIDSVLAAGTKSGYTITAVPAGGAGTQANPFTTFNSTAIPVAVGQSGQRSFCSDESGVIRYQVTGAAPPLCVTSGLPPLQ